MSSVDSTHPALQEAFGLTGEEYAVLLGDRTEREARISQLYELSLSLVGHLDREEVREFFHAPQKIGVGADLRYVPEHVPLDVATEPGGLQRVVTAARDEVGLRISAKTEATSGAPENK